MLYICRWDQFSIVINKVLFGSVDGYCFILIVVMAKTVDLYLTIWYSCVLIDSNPSVYGHDGVNQPPLYENETCESTELSL